MLQVQCLFQNNSVHSSHLVRFGIETTGWILSGKNCGAGICVSCQLLLSNSCQNEKKSILKSITHDTSYIRCCRLKVLSIKVNTEISLWITQYLKKKAPIIDSIHNTDIKTIRHAIPDDLMS